MSEYAKVELAESILDTLDALVVILDIEGRIIRFNRAAEHLTGFKESEVLRQCVWDAVVSDHDKNVVREVFGDLLEGGKPSHFENSWTTIDGDQRDIVWSNTVIKDQDGKVSHIIGTGIDVTSERRMRKVIENDRAQLRTINDGVHDAIITTDELGDVLSFNVNAERLFGYDVQEVTGRSFTVLFDGITKDRNRDSIQRYLSQSFERLSGKKHSVIARRKDGTFFPARLNIAKVILDDRPFFTAFVQDDSEIAQAAKEIDELNSSLIHAARLSDMGELVGTITHEVSQPLSAIINYAAAGQRLVEQQSSSEKLSEVFEKIERQTYRVNEIIENLRHFLREGDHDQKPVNLNAIVQQAIELSALTMPEGRVSIQADIDPELPMIWADELQILQAVENLVRNAHDSVKKSTAGRINIIARQSRGDEGFVELIVSDNGEGIDPEMTDHLFKAFKTTKLDGMGLGLSITKRIIDAHDGSLELIENSKSGATFQILLPVHEGEDQL